MTRELPTVEGKSSERHKPVYPTVADRPPTTSEETDDPQIEAERMEPGPSTSTCSEESSYPQDLFMSWKKDTVGTICDKLSERQRSAFIYVSIIYFIAIC